MTSYVKRGYEIADAFRARGIPVIMGGVHPSFMSDRGARACRRGRRRRSRAGHAAGAGRPRAGPASRHLQVRPAASDGRACRCRATTWSRSNRYVNRTFIQTSRGCHHGCTFCSEPLMNGLRFRYRPVDEVIREVESCGQRYVSPERCRFLRYAASGRRRSCARSRAAACAGRPGVTSKLALTRTSMLELAAESGCYMLCIGFELISRRTLTQRPQARQSAGHLPGAGREDSQLRHPGVRLVHLRIRQ